MGARDDDDERAFPQPIDAFAVEQVSCGGCRRHGDEYNVRRVDEFVHVDALDIPFLEQCIGDERIEACHRRAECPAPLRNLPAYLAEGDYADAFGSKVAVDEIRVIAELVRHGQFLWAPYRVLPVPEAFSLGELFVPLRCPP